MISTKYYRRMCYLYKLFEFSNDIPHATLTLSIRIDRDKYVKLTTKEISQMLYSTG